mmetsp:Transcript_3519/g.22132  ORF Transcript_3519/g.22132 Transcript_3519/m.22132 type:complete len:242 (-) Transcript_3519:1640-2365(-)
MGHRSLAFPLRLASLSSTLHADSVGKRWRPWPACRRGSPALASWEGNPANVWNATIKACQGMPRHVDGNALPSSVFLQLQIVHGRSRNAMHRSESAVFAPPQPHSGSKWLEARTEHSMRLPFRTTHLCLGRRSHPHTQAWFGTHSSWPPLRHPSCLAGSWWINRGKYTHAGFLQHQSLGRSIPYFPSDAARMGRRADPSACFHGLHDVVRSTRTSLRRLVRYGRTRPPPRLCTDEVSHPIT